MKVLTSDQEKVLDRLLVLAGNSYVLEKAIERVQERHLEKPVELKDLLEAIDEVKSEAKGHLATA